MYLIVVHASKLFKALPKISHVSIIRSLQEHSPKLKPLEISKTISHQAKHEQSDRIKLIYNGKLTNRVLYLKFVSVSTSVLLAGSYGYVLQKNGLSLALAGMGAGFSIFFLSPFVISWFFKRYVTRLFYNYDTDTYKVYHYGLFTNIKEREFKCNQVEASDISSILNTFKVDGKPFFLHEEDLLDAESVSLYKRMIGLTDASRIKEFGEKLKV